MTTLEEKRHSLYLVLMEICLFFIIVFHSVNFDLKATIRPVDLMILTALGIWILFGRIKLDFLMMTVCLLAILFVLSIAYGVINYEKIDLTKLGMTYKFFMPFLMFFVLKDMPMSEKRVNDFTRIHFYAVMATVFFVYIHVALYVLGFLPNAHIRPNFPFTRYSLLEDTQKHAGHVYSAYVSLAIIQFLVAWRYKMIKVGRIFGSSVLFMSIGALILTGSRNGIITIFLSTIVFVFIEMILNKQKIKIRPSTLLLLWIFCLIGTVFLLVAGWYVIQHDVLTALVTRTFDIKAGGAGEGRLVKFTEAVNLVLVQGNFFIGIGLTAAPKAWYDNLIATLLIQTGFLGCMFFFLFFIVILKKNYTDSIKNRDIFIFNACFLLIFNYGFANFVTEFFLITRSVLPFITFIVLIMKTGQYRANKKRSLNEKCLK